MAKLGGAFSNQDRRAFAERQLKPGAVLYLDVTFPETRKPKYLVLADVDDECCTLIINSEVSAFIESHPELSVCQVRIDSARHSFLRRDSYIACEKVLRLSTDAVVTELIADTSRLKGQVHAEVIVEIVAAIKRAPTLSPIEQTAIVRSLETVLD